MGQSWGEWAWSFVPAVRKQNNDNVGGAIPPPTSPDTPAVPVGHPPIPTGTKAECPVPVGQRSAAAEHLRDAAQRLATAQLDGSNNMPHAESLQQQLPGQTAALPKERVVSTIPKGTADTKEKWEYPSEQMFYTALQRKNKAQDVAESDVGTMVAIHNNMNERAWDLVQEWERLHVDKCGNPSLVRFMGRPTELTPKAWIKRALGLAGTPFDRHDWYVDRCGETVRYVIDFYHNDNANDRVPSLHEQGAVQSITMDARPAIDTPSALFDRFRLPLYKQFGLGSYGHDHPSIQRQSNVETKSDTPSSTTSSDQGASHSVFDEMSTIAEKCASAREAMENCKSDEECSVAQVGLDYCMGQVVCPGEAQAFFTALQSAGDADPAFRPLQACVSRWRGRAAQAMGGIDADKTS